MSALGMVLLSSLGCTKAAKFAGTWILQQKAPMLQSGDCADSGDPDSEVESTLGFIEIYGADDGEIVVMTGEVLKGASDGNSFTATYDYVNPGSDTGGGWSESEKVSASLEGKVLSGTYTASQTWGDWTCTSELKFAAVRVEERDNI